MKKNMLIVINNIFAEISGWFLLAMMLLLVLDIVSRTMYKPIQGVGEMAVFVLVASVYLGIPHGEETKTHVRVEIFTSKLPFKIKKIIDIFAFSIAVITMGFVVYAVGGSAIQAYKTKEAIAGTVLLVIYPIKFVLFLGCLFYLFQLVINTIKEFKDKKEIIK